jgi:hypothetical protein
MYGQVCGIMYCILRHVLYRCVTSLDSIGQVSVVIRHILLLHHHHHHRTSSLHPAAITCISRFFVMTGSLFFSPKTASSPWKNSSCDRVEG